MSQVTNNNEKGVLHVLEFDVDGQTVGENNYVGDFDGGQYFTGVLDV